jgi:hypothetical protein
LQKDNWALTVPNYNFFITEKPCHFTGVVAVWLVNGALPVPSFSPMPRLPHTEKLTLPGFDWLLEIKEIFISILIETSAKLEDVNLKGEETTKATFFFCPSNPHAQGRCMPSNLRS